MEIPTGGKGTLTELKLGEPTSVNPNRPVKAQIKFLNGSWIECIIPANGAFQVCNEGDVVEFNLIIEDDSFTPIALVSGSEGPTTDTS